MMVKEQGYSTVSELVGPWRGRGEYIEVNAK